jgi:SNF2 family DNA or RNA helicase
MSWIAQIKFHTVWSKRYALREMFVLRRLKCDITSTDMVCEGANVVAHTVQSPIPQCHILQHNIEFSEEEDILYTQLTNHATIIYQTLSAQNQLMYNMTTMLEWMLRCRQLCASPRIMIDSIRKKNIRSLVPAGISPAIDMFAATESRIPSKIAYLLKCINNTHRNQKAIVFSHWTTFMNEIHTTLKKCGKVCFNDDERLMALHAMSGHQTEGNLLSSIPIEIKEIIMKQLFMDVGMVVLHGGMNDKQRADALHSFKTDPRTHVMLAQINVGGLGLNLPEASHVYLMEPHWNPAVEAQAASRVHRYGQKNTVYIHRLIMKRRRQDTDMLVEDKDQPHHATIEERIVEHQNAKLSLSAQILADNIDYNPLRTHESSVAQQMIHKLFAPPE